MGISTSVKNLYYAKKKKKSSAHSFSPFALMIDPSKENCGSAVYFLFLCEKIPKITELQGGNLAPTSSYKQQEPHGRPSVIFGNFCICYTQWQKVDLATPLFFTRI